MEIKNKKVRTVFVRAGRSAVVNVPEERHAEIDQVIKEHAERESAKTRHIVVRPL